MEIKNEVVTKESKILYMAGTAKAHISLLDRLSSMVIGQEEALSAIIPYVQMFKAGLSPEGRPVGNILLCGNTGLGKTSTVEALADAIHGDFRKNLRIDCGEFQMEHEVAKLIGAPPGYLGHRETTPMLTQAKLNAVTSDTSNLSLVLFDEIEKASQSLLKLLLGVMDKASLKLGDSTSVNFERSLIFFSSNLGAKQINSFLRDSIGYKPTEERKSLSSKQLKDIIKREVVKHFSSEFYNRIDEIAYYYPFSNDNLNRIVSLEMERVQHHYNTRLGGRSFMVGISDAMFDFLKTTGTSPEYGARELKRVIARNVTKLVVDLIVDGDLPAGSILLIDRKDEDTEVGVMVEYSSLPSGYHFFDRRFLTVVEDSDSEVIEIDGEKKPKRRKKLS